MATKSFFLSLGIIVTLASVTRAGDRDHISGHWRGAVTRDGAVQLINISWERNGQTLGGTIDIPALGMFAEPLKEISYSHPNLSFRFIYGTFSCTLNSKFGEITGINKKWGPPVRIHLKRGEWMRDRITKKEIVFPSGELRLEGTLVLPTGVVPRATVVMLHGSGQSGRENWTYRGLAHVLAQNGIASLLYEKRTVPIPEGESKFELLAKDAVAAVAFLKKHPDLHASKIGLFGASQGGWIAPLAASQCEDVAFAILHAGPAVSVWDQEVHRVKYTMQADGLPNDEVDQAVKYTEDVFAFVRSGRGWGDIARRTKEIEKKSWAQYLAIPTSREDAREWQTEKFDPKAALTQTACPVLAIFGEDDTIVPPAENITLMKRFLKEAGNPLSKVVTFENVGHGMELNRSLLGDEWKWPTGFWVWPRKAPDYYDTILSWLSKQIEPGK